MDFIVKDREDKIKYVQIAITVTDNDKLKQELCPFDDIKDNYPKYIIAFDDYFIKDHNGVTTINAIDFLLGQNI